MSLAAASAFILHFLYIFPARYSLALIRIPWWTWGQRHSVTVGRARLHLISISSHLISLPENWSVLELRGPPAVCQSVSPMRCFNAWSRVIRIFYYLLRTDWLKVMFEVQAVPIIQLFCIVQLSDFAAAFLRISSRGPRILRQVAASPSNVQLNRFVEERG